MKMNNLFYEEHQLDERLTFVFYTPTSYNVPLIGSEIYVEMNAAIPRISTQFRMDMLIDEVVRERGFSF
jgi:hypothetical protein